MRKLKKRLVLTKFYLNSSDEILEHIIKNSNEVINLDECQINETFDLRVILTKLKKIPAFSDKISIKKDVNEFGYTVFYCILEIPFRCETTIFTKGAYFELVEFKDFVIFGGAVFESDYSFKKSIFHNSVNFSSVDFEAKELHLEIIPFYRTIFKSDVSFFNAYFHSLVNFRLATFYNGVDFGESEFSNIDLSGIEMKNDAKLINYETATFQLVNNRITGLYLKQYALKMNDSVNALKFKKMEMDAYRRYLISKLSTSETSGIALVKNKIDALLDLAILYLNKWSNSHGNNFLKGILFTLAMWFVFFSWFIITRDGIGKNFIWTDGQYLKEAVNYLWIFNGIEEIVKNNSVTWKNIIPYFLGKILMTYGIYQTIAAFRKYNK